MAKTFIVTAAWDGESGTWSAHNDEIPVTTEADSFDRVVERVLEIAPELIDLNRLAAPGEEISIRVVAERTVLLPAA